ncbi:MAG TPA: response regulator [Nitrosomonas sp.]|nr:response regulator [Nitrosomonas sp.]
MTQPTRVFIIDDDEAIRDSLQLMLETVDIDCQLFSSAEEFLERFDMELSGCIVLDLNLPGMNGIELQAELERRNIRLPIIFLTSYGTVPITVQAMKSGAVDFLTKPVAIEDIFHCIQVELQKQSQNNDELESEKLFLQKFNTLSAREKQILQLVLAGNATKEIAHQLDISARTVEIHRTQILKKMTSSSFLELASQCTMHNVTF